jgi:hypothetical protein
MYEMTILEELECIYSEMHKDVYGVKARWIEFSSEEEARMCLASLQLTLEAKMAEDELIEAKNIADFEAKVLELIESGAKDRSVAIRWLDEAHGTDGDMEFLCYHLGLPYSYFNRKV